MPDLLYGSRTASGKGTYVLAEMNASSHFAALSEHLALLRR
jgi:hypothetical protein